MYEANQKSPQQQKDYELPDPPIDSISALEFVPRSSSWNALCAGSWDKSVSVWEVQTDKVVPKAKKSLDGIPLDAAWNDSGSKIYVADTNGAVIQWDLESNQLAKVGAHEQGARTCHWLGSYLITTSWDKTMRFWDPRTPIELAKRDLPDRSFAADVLHPMAVVACADQSVMVLNLNTGPLDQTQMICPGQRSSQVRSVAICQGKELGASSWFLAKSDGIVYEQSLMKSSRVIRCHRKEALDGFLDTHAVHEVKVNRVTNQMATVGSDGVFCFWDSQMSNMLMQSQAHDQPITKCSISGDGQLFAYALGYDWSKGYEHCDPNKKPQIFLRPFGI
ncbi:protein Rae1 [Drosophila takahashii]|uniref:protein Rae1 n=1 Tax=Drosophila takahashii TaxID=29030 RepID=UPI001CF81331|nr:protein Rae1 [Drosophila takahashii]